MALTPLMQQYQTLKQKNPDALLFFRCGDFYELFFEDAREASERLGIALTARGGVPMAGVPHHSVEGYLKRLVDQGVRVAIAEQLTDPKQTKGLVERGVVDVLSPGTVTAWAMLDEKRANHIVAIAPAGRGRGRGRGPRRCGLAWLDVSTGALGVTELPEDALDEEIARLEASETLVPDTDAGEALLAAYPRLPFPKRCPAFSFDPRDGRRVAQERLGVQSLAAFGADGLGPGLGAVGALLRFLETQKPDHLKAVRGLERIERDRQLVLDPATRRALELVATTRGRARKGSLLWALDRTRTAMGARRLRAWIQSPLCDLAAITARHDAVEDLLSPRFDLAALTEALRGIYDLERLAARVASERATPRDLAALRRSLGRLPEVAAALAGAPRLAALAAEAAPLPELSARLGRELVDEPPLTVTEGGVIRKGVSADLDQLRALGAEGKGFIAAYQKTQRERTGISSLKIGHNAVFGYYLEVTNAHRKKVPPDFRRKQTLKSSERYITDELKRFEEQVQTAKERSDRLEHELFGALRHACEREVGALRRRAEAVATLDALSSFAQVATERGYVRPQMEETGSLRIRGGRHPVLEQTLEGAAFVPNDVRLGGAGPDGEPVPFVGIVTGPNMAGKSTYCRQTALLALMAQAGSFVPADQARIGICDRIFARIGASDEIASGLSTFMVEMTETAYILRHATDRSLVILDEVGRGTSTFDGVSLAFAITRYLAGRSRSRTLFATHYHELTELQEVEPAVKNLGVEVKEWGSEIIFLHKIREGSTDKSYGLHVARLAGVPGEVLAEAEEVLSRLEQQHLDLSGRPRLVGGGSSKAASAAPREVQRDLFAPPTEHLKAALLALDVSRTTPLDALTWLAEWQAKVRGSG